MEAVKEKSKTKSRKSKAREKKFEDDAKNCTQEMPLSNSIQVPSCPEYEPILDCNDTVIQEPDVLSKELLVSTCEQPNTNSYQIPDLIQVSEENSQHQSVDKVELNETFQIPQLNVVEECSIPVEIARQHSFVKSSVKHLYPTLEDIDSEVTSYQPLIEAHKAVFFSKALSLANMEHAEFHKRVTDLGNHEFHDLIFQYKSSRQNLLNLQEKIDSLRFSFKTLDLQLWVEETKTALVKQTCGDDNTVEVSRKYAIRHINTDVEKKIHEDLKKLEESLPHHAFEEYHTRFLKSKINLYLYFLNDYCKYGVIETPPSTNTIFSSFSQASCSWELLKTCISILFHFQRLPTLDTGFIMTTRKWLTNLIAVVYSTGSHSDRMFVLNHILRCPSNINTWASTFIQFPSDYSLESREKGSANGGFQYALASLLVLLSPVPERQDFLKHIKPCPYHTHVCPPECNFLVIDCTGKEMKTISFEREWNEKDVLTLFQQIPFSQILENATNLVLTDEKLSGSVDELKMQKLIAFSTFLLDLLCSGFSNFPQEFFSNVAKTVGQFLCSTVTYLSHYWKNFKLNNPAYNCCFQVEIDRVLFHCVYIIQHSKASQAMVYLQEMPYDSASSKMLWNLLWLFHDTSQSDEGHLFAMKDVEVKLKDREMRSLLQEYLLARDESDFLYILKALRKMALSPKSEKDFTYCITLELFETFCRNKMRLPHEQLSTISTIVLHYPLVVSVLLKSLDDASIEVVQCAIELFEVLDLKNWIPQTEDMNRISTWLLSEVLSSPQNQLSRLILKQLNWNFEGDKLVLPIELHRQVALLVVKAYLQYDTNGNSWLVSSGIKQLLNMISPLQGSDQGFISFAWQLLFSLKLHALSHPKPSWVKIFDGSVDYVEYPNVHTEPWLHTLLSAHKENNPAASYVVVAMTKTGHSLKYLSNDGLCIFAAFVDLKQFPAAVQTLYFILPFFVKNEELLLTTRFLSSLKTLITVDKLAFPDGKVVAGTVLSKIEDMIKIQLFEAGKYQIECVNPILKLWVSLLTKILLMVDKGQSKMSSPPKQMYFLLDMLIKIAYMHPHTRFGTIDLMTELTRPLMYKSEEKTSWRPMFSKSDKLSPLFPSPSSGFPWFAWSVIVSEGNQKVIQDMWLDMCNVMAIDEKLSVDSAYKKFCDIRLEKNLSVSVQNLPIYRWLGQALKTPFEHPLLPVIWQNFFLFYFQRTSLSGVQQRDFSMGPRFFVSENFKYLMVNCRSRLKATVDFYEKEKEKYLHQTQSDNKHDIKDHLGAYQKANNLFTLFQAFSTWIDDEKLHKTVCLPALQPHYKSEKLKLILEKDAHPWLEYIDFEKLKSETFPKTDLWTSMHSSNSNTEDQRKEFSIAPAANILPPPESKKIDVPALLLNCDLSNSSENELKLTLEKFQDAVCNEAVKFEKKLSKLRRLNRAFIQYIPEEFVLKEEQVEVTRPCHRGKNCTGPVYVMLTIQKVVTVERVQNLITTNRTDFDNTVSEIIRPPVENVCNAAIHMELILKKLIQEINASQHEKTNRLTNLGISLFYHQIDKIQKVLSTEVDIYSPTNQFFATSIEILGKELIEGREDQVLPLLDKLLANSLASQLVSPYFMPNNLSEDMYISVYKTVIDAISSHSSADIFVLLSKLKLSKWISANQASYDCRKQLLKIICNALKICITSQETNEKAILYDLVKRHFKGIIAYEYPQLFFDAVETALTVSEYGASGIDIWEALFSCMGCSLTLSERKLDVLESTIAKFALNRMLTPDQRLYIHSPPLSLNHIIHALKHFHLYFMRASKQFSLYVKFKSCLKAIALFLSIMGHSLLELSNAESDGFLPKEEKSKTSYVWHLLHCAFQPWIDPHISDSRNNLEFPWPSSEEDNAKCVFEIFSCCIRFHHSNFSDRGSDVSILSFALSYYERAYVRHGIRNYSVGVCHSSFNVLPWEAFNPSIDDIETMYKVLQSDISECREFVIGIIMTVSWIEVVNVFGTTKSQRFMGQLLGYVAKIFVKCGWENCTAKKNNHRNLTKELEKLSWDCVMPETVEEILGIYIHYCQPLNLLHPNSTDNDPELYILNFLKVVSGFSPKDEMPKSVSNYSTGLLQQKRQLYLHKVMELYGLCLTRENEPNKAIVNSIASVVSSHLEEVESIILKDFSPGDLLTKAIPYVHEVLQFFNIVQNEEIRKKALDVLLLWLQSKINSPLLLPCIQCASGVIRHIPTTIAIVEMCISSMFSTELKDPNEAMVIWNTVTSCFQIPVNMHEDFIKPCIEQGACFTLYKYVMQRMSWASTNQARALLFRRLIVWICEINISESSEVKVMLLWDKAFELAFKLLDDQDSEIVKSEMLSFSRNISSIVEDGGFLSYFGFRKTVPFSVSFRFICSAMAAYLLAQIPDEGSLRVERGASGHISQSPLSPPANQSPGFNPQPHPSAEALNALKELKALANKKAYSALKIQIERTLANISNPQCSFMESRCVLKELGLQVFPNSYFLYLLNS